MNDKEVQDMILSIISENFNIDYEKLIVNLDTSFFDKPFLFNYVNLVYLYMLVVSKFDIQIKEEDLLNGAFKNINSVVALLV